MRSKLPWLLEDAELGDAPRAADRPNVPEVIV